MLDVGEKVFEQGDFEELSMDQIAGRAGVTRALLYHYFASKADYFAAIWQRAHENLGVAPDPSSGVTVRDWIADELAAHVDFYASHPHLVIIANRSSVAANPTVRDPVSAHFRSLGQVLLNAARCVGPERPLAEVAFDGWIAFVREVILAALVERAIGRDRTISLCMAALDATVGAHADLGVVPKRR